MVEQAATTSVMKRPARPMVVLVAVLRLVALLVSTELSGAAHALLDVATSAAGAEHPRDDCDDEESGHECPPGCPNCHCTHGAVVQLAPRTAPQSAARLAILHPPPHQAGFVPLDAMPPQGADRTRLYRPPRAAFAS